MVEIKYEIIKPNLYTADDIIYVGIEKSKLIPVVRDIDRIIRNNIGNLKVKESNLELVKYGKTDLRPDQENYKVPLIFFLNELIKSDVLEKSSSITSTFGKIFDLSYLINAHTHEDLNELLKWQEIKYILENTDEYIKNYEIPSWLKLDREEFLKRVREDNEKLAPKISENSAELIVVNGIDKLISKEAYAMKIGIYERKTKDKAKIEETNSKLIEILKKADGPTLSLDLPSFFRQFFGLHSIAPGLVLTYGDLITGIGSWREKLFKIDP